MVCSDLIKWVSTGGGGGGEGCEQQRHSLISAFVIPVLVNSISKLATGEISIF